MAIGNGIIDSQLPSMSGNQWYFQKQSCSINNIPCLVLFIYSQIKWQSFSYLLYRVLITFVIRRAN
jgi:hypothetical protein